MALKPSRHLAFRPAFCANSGASMWVRSTGDESPATIGLALFDEKGAKKLLDLLAMDIRSTHGRTGSNGLQAVIVRSGRVNAFRRIDMRTTTEVPPKPARSRMLWC